MTQLHSQLPYPHDGGCNACRAEGVCNVCGGPTIASTRCTNGRCGVCHRACCTDGGATSPGHGYGDPVVWRAQCELLGYKKPAALEPYPEHVRLRAISDKSQAIGEFLEWLGDEKAIWLCTLLHANAQEQTEAGYYPISTPKTKLLAEYFEIDEDAIEREKRAMLDELRKSA